MVGLACTVPSNPRRKNKLGQLLGYNPRYILLMEYRTLFLLLQFLLHVLSKRVKAIPSPPAFCDNQAGACFVTNAYGAWSPRQICRVSEIRYPSSEEELLEAVAYGAKNRMKMKAVSRLSHSIPPLACPGGSQGLLISTTNLTRGIVVDRSSKTAIVDSGVQLHDLLNAASKVGMALSASTYWNGLSIAGILSTGSHGSSWMNKGSAVHDHVAAIRLVVPLPLDHDGDQEQYAKVVQLTPADGDKFFAALVSLGAFGVISKITLHLEPMFKRSITNIKKSDADLEDRIVAFGNEHEFGDVIWYPSKKQTVYRVDDRVPVSTAGDGVNEFTGFQPILPAVIETQRALEETFEAKRSSMGKCLTSSAQIAVLQSVAYGLKDTPAPLSVFTGYPVVGFQHKMQSAGGCQLSRTEICGWDSAHKALFYHEAGATIASHMIQDFLSDVKKLRDSNPDAGSMCGVDLYTGVLLRYVKKSRALLGKQFDGVDVGFTYYRARNGSEPRLHQDVWEEIEQMAIFKYGGLPHWGKNKRIMFADPGAAYPKIAEFVRIMKEMDPEGLFSSEWSDEVLGIVPQASVDTQGCALEGACICSTDEHCAPHKGYFCRPGRVFTKARVCRHGEEAKKKPRQTPIAA